jgi:hypothetical protein
MVRIQVPAHHIPYFFIKNWLDLKSVDVQHCPTKQMLADFFTKPLPGNLFPKFGDVIVGHKHIDSLKETMPTLFQERAERRSLPRNVRNGADGQKTDVIPQEPVTATYANITRKRAERKPFERVRKAFLSLSRINPMVRTV